MITQNQSTWIFKCFLSDFSLLNHKCIFVSVILLNSKEKTNFSNPKAVSSVYKRQLLKPITVLEMLVKFPQNTLLKYIERTKKTLILKIYAVKFR